MKYKVKIEIALIFKNMIIEIHKGMIIIYLLTTKLKKSQLLFDEKLYFICIDFDISMKGARKIMIAIHMKNGISYVH